MNTKDTITPQLGMKFNYALGSYIITSIDLKRRAVVAKETSGDYEQEMTWNYDGLTIFLTENPDHILEN